jgi:hypothetical protein
MAGKGLSSSQLVVAVLAQIPASQLPPRRPALQGFSSANGNAAMSSKTRIMKRCPQCNCLETEVLSAPRSPWQNPYVERLIGSIRRECLDHVIGLNEHHLRRVLQRYFGYYHRTRTHLSVDKDAPDTRPVQLPAMGKVIEMAEVGGLHYRYERRAA